MINILQNIKYFFGKVNNELAYDNNVKQFRQTEDKISGIFGVIEQLRFKYRNSQRKIREYRMKLNNISTQNPGINIETINSENNVEFKRLKRLKLFTIIMEAVISVQAINTFLNETLNVDLHAGMEGSKGLAVIVRPLLFAIPFAFILLMLAIDYKYNDKAYIKDDKNKYWYKYSGLVPIFIIPFLNGFNIMTHPIIATNWIFGFLSVLTIILNLKCINYSEQFQKYYKTIDVKKMAKPLLNSIIEEEKIQNTINKEVIQIKLKLNDYAILFKRQFENFKDNMRPKLSLNPLYIILLNNKFYLGPVLPVPELAIMNPPGSQKDLFNFWDKMNEYDIPDSNISDDELNPSETTNLLDGHMKDNATMQNDTKGKTNPDFKDSNKADNPAPNISDIIEDAEIFV